MKLAHVRACRLPNLSCGRMTGTRLRHASRRSFAASHTAHNKNTTHLAPHPTPDLPCPGQSPTRSTASVLTQSHSHKHKPQHKTNTLSQCVELDFQYPSEGIHRRWDAGFRITACAATPDQAAFVISVPRRRPMDETQETLRTSAFPSSHVKEKWAKNLYIAGIAYGRTVS